MKVLDCILDQLLNEGSRPLIYVHRLKMADILSEYFELKQIGFIRCDGSMHRDDRDKALEKMVAPDVNDRVFLMTMQIGAVGLTLTHADSVIFYDGDKNPQIELQAFSRVHWLGQKKRVRLFRLIVQNTVDVYMLRLLRQVSHRNNSLHLNLLLQNHNQDQNLDLDRIHCYGYPLLIDCHCHGCIHLMNIRQPLIQILER